MSSGKFWRKTCCSPRFAASIRHQNHCRNPQKRRFPHRAAKPTNRCPQPGLNRRPLPYQGSALPLSYVGARRKSERVKGIEPSHQAWKAYALPLSYTRQTAVAAAIQNSFLSAWSGKSFYLWQSLAGNLPRAGWREQDLNLRRLSRQIYSLVPLTARESLPSFPLYHKFPVCVNYSHFFSVSQKNFTSLSNWRHNSK